MSEADEELYQRLDAERPCPRCAALESEVARLKTALAEASEIDRDALETSARRMTERDSARALLHDLTAAVRALDGEIPYTTGWKRSRETMLILLRRAEAEAGEESANG